jgi:hypothetical protein
MIRTLRAMATLASVATLGAGIVHAQCAAVPSNSVTSTRLFTTLAVVEAIDQNARTLTLKGEGGRVITTHVPPEVRNFDQIAVGDRVRAEVRDAFVLAIRRPGAGGPSAGTATVLSVAPPGDKPAAATVRTTEVAATVIAIDVEQRLVTLRGPRGNEWTIHVDANVEGFRDLKPGDAVIVRHTEAVTIAVEKAP